MKAKIFFVAFTLILVSSVYSKEPIPSADEKAATGIEFHEGTWAEALELAEESGKTIFLNISASWCGPCKALKRTTFPNEEVGAYFNEHFVNVYVDGEKGEGKDLVKKFKIRGYPTMIFLDSKGEVLAKTSGYREANEMIDLGKEVQEL